MNQVQKNYVKSRLTALLVILAIIGAGAAGFTWYWVAVAEIGILLLFMVSVGVIEIICHYRYKWRVLAVTEPGEEHYFERFFYLVKHDLFIDLDNDYRPPEEIAYIKKIREIEKPKLL